MKRKIPKILLAMFILVLSFSTSVFAATLPTGLTATAGDTQIVLDWEDTVDGQYNVYRSLDDSTFTKITASPIAVSTYTDTGLTNDTIYYYTVTSYDGSAESAQTASTSATPIAVVATGGIDFTGVTLPFTVADMLTTAVNFLTIYAEWILIALGVIFAPVLYGLAMKLVSAIKART